MTDLDFVQQMAAAISADTDPPELSEEEFDPELHVRFGPMPRHLANLHAFLRSGAMEVQASLPALRKAYEVAPPDTVEEEVAEAAFRQMLDTLDLCFRSAQELLHAALRKHFPQHKGPEFGGMAIVKGNLIVGVKQTEEERASEFMRRTVANLLGGHVVGVVEIARAPGPRPSDRGDKKLH